jgi:hypothetical protein
VAHRRHNDLKQQEERKRQASEELHTKTLVHERKLSAVLDTVDTLKIQLDEKNQLVDAFEQLQIENSGTKAEQSEQLQAARQEITYYQEAIAAEKEGILQVFLVLQKEHLQNSTTATDLEAELHNGADGTVAELQETLQTEQAHNSQLAEQFAATHTQLRQAETAAREQELSDQALKHQAADLQFAIKQESEELRKEQEVAAKQSSSARRMVEELRKEQATATGLSATALELSSAATKFNAETEELAKFNTELAYTIDKEISDKANHAQLLHSLELQRRQFSSQLAEHAGAQPAVDAEQQAKLGKARQDKLELAEEVARVEEDNQNMQNTCSAKDLAVKKAELSLSMQNEKNEVLVVSKSETIEARCLQKHHTAQHAHTLTPHCPPEQQREFTNRTAGGNPGDRRAAGRAGAGE